MDVASLCALPVGVVRWNAPEPTVTVVVKATISLAREGEAALASEQEPLAKDRVSDLDADELEVAGDFAPLKGRADVVLTGYAFSATPASVIAAELSIEDVLRRSFFAHAGVPASAIPLSAAYLRAGPDAAASAISVAPQAPHAALRRHRLGGRTVLSSGLPDTPLDGGFDFGFFNVAPSAQQVEMLRVGATLRFAGLFEGGAPRVVHLPGLRPVVFVGQRSQPGRWTQMALRCDTLVIDTDRELCMLTWRGVLDQRALRDDATLAVASHTVGVPIRWRDIERRLPEATWSRAVESDDEAPRRSEPGASLLGGAPLGALSLSGVRLGALSLGGARLGAVTLGARPFGDASATSDVEVPSGAETPPSRMEVTLTDIPVVSVSVLPFEAPAARFLEPAVDEEGPVTPMYLGVAPGSVLPFEAPVASVSVLPFEAPSVPLPPRLLEPAGGLPFVTPVPAVASSEALQPVVVAAELRVARWAGREAFEQALGRHGLDPVAWAAEEQRQSDAIRRELGEGRLERTRALAQALRDASAGIEAPPLDPEVYVAIEDALSQGGPAAPVLEAHGMTPATWRQVQRQVRLGMRADPALARAVRAARVSLRSARAPENEP